MNNVPISAFDFFASVVPGLALMAVLDVGTGHYWLLGSDLPATSIILVIIGGYVVGHAIAEVAFRLLEERLVCKRVGRPEYLLLRAEPVATKLRTFAAPLPLPVVKAVRARARREGWTDLDLLDGDSDEVKSSSRALFLKCWATVQGDQITATRLATFSTLYNFSRNMCLTAMLAMGALVLTCSAEEGPSTEARLLLVCVCFLMTWIFFLRYLKFFRLYTVEVFVKFGAAPSHSEGG